MKKLIIIIVSVIFVFSACKLANPVDYILITPDMDFGGSLSLSLNADINPRTIAPDLDIVSYTISGIHEDLSTTFSETYDISIDPGPYIISGLLPGSWDITVEAYNVGSILIGSALELDVVITESDTTSRSVTITPGAGNGTLDVTVRWSTPLANPEVIARITELDLTEILPAPNFTEDAITGTATYSTSALSEGTYLLFLSLESDGVEVSSYVSVVRIIDGQTSFGDLTLALNTTGSLDLTVVISPLIQDVPKPFDLDITTNVPTLELSLATPLVTMSVDVLIDSDEDGTGETPGTSHQWFLNGAVFDGDVSGVVIDTTDPLTDEVGSYNLAVIVTDSLGDVSSDSITFTIDP